MCKKLLIGLMSLMIVGLCAGLGQAALIQTFTDIQDLNPTLGAGTYTYFHQMPGDYSAPPPAISANLEITYGKGIALGTVTVNGELVGSRFLFNLNGTKDIGFDVRASLDPWTLGVRSLQVDLWGAAAIDFQQSILTLVYYPTDVPGNHTAVPESSTLILLGSGLLGLIVAGRKKFRK